MDTRVHEREKQYSVPKKTKAGMIHLTTEEKQPNPPATWLCKRKLG